MTQLLGCIPAVGIGRDIALSGDYAYIGSDQFGLAVVNVKYPGNLRPTGIAKPSFYGTQVAADGALAVVCSVASGFKVIDCSTITNPLTVATILGSFRQVAISGTMAYADRIISGNPPTNFIQCISLANPAVPVIVGQCVVGAINPYGNILYNNGRIYICNGYGQIQVVDVTDPTNPHIIASITTRSSEPRDCAIVGNTLYVSDTDSVCIIDISNINNPQILGHADCSNTTDIACNGSYVVILDSPVFRIIDVRTPTAPVEIFNRPSIAQGVAMTSNAIFFVTTPEGTAPNRSGGLQSYNFEIPSYPWFQDECYGESDNFGIFANGTGVAAIAAGLFGFNIYSVSDTSAPSFLGAITNVGGQIPKGSVVKNICGDLLQFYCRLVSPGNPPKIELIAISTEPPASPGRPAVIGRCTLLGSTVDLDCLGTGYVGVAASDRFLIIDVSTPTAPAALGTLTLAAAYGLTLATDRAYVVGEDNVYSINTSVLSAPVLTSTLNIPGMRGINCYLGSSNKLYVIGGNKLWIIDVTNPAAMVLRSSISIPSSQAVTSIGNKAYVCVSAGDHIDGTGGIRVVDTTVATAPVLGILIVNPGVTRSITNRAGIVYAGDSSAQLAIIEA